MDCEGAEGMIFTPITKEYLKKIREMDIEFHDTCSSLKHEEIKALLEKAGFQVELHWPFGKSSLYGAIHAKRIE